MKILRYASLVMVSFLVLLLHSSAQAQGWAIVNSASYISNSISPGSLTTIYDTDLTNQTLNASAGTLPTQLGDVQVRIVDANNVQRFAGLSFVSPNQTNLVIPTSVTVGNATITINRPYPRASLVQIHSILSVAPGIFFSGSWPNMQIYRVNNTTGAETWGNLSIDPVTYQPMPIQINRNGNDTVYFILYGTGFYGAYSQVSCRFNSSIIPPPYVWAGPGAGVDQINIQVPVAGSA